MNPDVLMDAVHIAFETGLLYTLRYFNMSSIMEVTDEDVRKLSIHLSETKTWRDVDEWQEFIKANLKRWREI